MTERASSFRRLLLCALRPVVTIAALLYFLLDALAYWVVRPLARWIGGLAVFAWFAGWVGGLGRYPSLMLVVLPLALLEPAKPVAAWLIATGRPLAGILMLAVAELIKITLVERLFHLTRAKLMTIPWFAWIFTRAVRWLDRLKALPPWQAILRAVGRMKDMGRRFLMTVRSWG